MNKGEYRSSGKPRSTILSGNRFRDKEVTYVIIDGDAIFEGDIVLGPAEVIEAAAQARGPEEAARALDRRERAERGIGITGGGYRWPNRTIPYTIDAALPDTARVTDAIAHWEANTLMRFVTRGTQANYVTFRSGDGCSSSVGMRGGRQYITLGSACTTGNAIHEIGHAVGLWHEQSREDRDSFVTIDFTNIEADSAHNFNQHITDGDDIGAYDYGSLMHYGAYAFAIDPTKPTIISPQPIGQRNGLSAGDIDAVRKIYSVSAAVEHPNGKAYFFRDDRYQRFDFASDRIDKTNARINIDGWRGVWTTGIDAALVHPRNGKAYFFRGDRYQRFDFTTDRIDKTDARINIDGWRGVWTTGIDAALVHPRNGKAYFFRGDRYQRFDFTTDRIDKDNARIGIDGWRGVWTTGIDAALVHPRNGKAYFFRGDRYQRFDFDSDRIDKDNARIDIDGWRDVWPGS